MHWTRHPIEVHQIACGFFFRALTISLTLVLFSDLNVRLRNAVSIIGNWHCRSAIRYRFATISYKIIIKYTPNATRCFTYKVQCRYSLLVTDWKRFVFWFYFALNSILLWTVCASFNCPLSFAVIYYKTSFYK